MLDIGKSFSHLMNPVCLYRLWPKLSTDLTVGQQMDAPIWKDVYCKTIDSDTDESMTGDEVFTLLALMDIPLRQRTMEMYQAERNYV